MANVNSANDEHVVFRGFHFTADFGGQTSIAGLNFAHFQCASQCPDQSTRGRGDDVIESGGMRLAEFSGVHAVVGSDGSVDAEYHRVGFSRQIRQPERATYAFDANVGNVSWFSHVNSSRQSDASIGHHEKDSAERIYLKCDSVRLMPCANSSSGTIKLTTA